jgi:hypothetical protein
MLRIFLRRPDFPFMSRFKEKYKSAHVALKVLA